MKKQLTIAALALAICSCNQGGQASKQSFNSSADYPEWQYTELKNEVKKGWNSWDTRSVFTQVFFPELNGVKLALVDAKGNVNDRICVGNREEDAAIVHPYDHTYDGT